jgi:threonine dehydrogenase-like Zn-dependent dehydrogenase
VIGVDLVPERLAMAARHGVETLDVTDVDDVPGALIDLTGGRGPDSVIEAVGMEAHGSPRAKAAQTVAGLLPDALSRPFVDKGAVDRMAALHAAMKCVRRGGTLSISGVYGGELDPIPMMELFDRQVTIRMGQANVRRWTNEIVPLLTGDGDPLGVGDLVTHRVGIDDAPAMYETFQKKEDGCIKVVLDPWAA